MICLNSGSQKLSCELAPAARWIANTHPGNTGIDDARITTYTQNVLWTLHRQCIAIWRFLHDRRLPVTYSSGWRHNILRASLWMDHQVIRQHYHYYAHNERNNE